jgi:GNAT superfamily N-acetyltransferase
MAVTHPIRIARIAALPEAFEDLAADAMADGQKVLEVLREDWRLGAIRFDRPGEALFAALAGQALIGLCGLTRDPYVKSEPVGRVRRLYVRRAARRHGAGRALVEAVIAEARIVGWPRLRVRAPAAAFAFYEACGFLRAIGEGAATHALPLAARPVILPPSLPCAGTK